MKIKTAILFLALCVTMGVSSQGRIKPGNEVAMKLFEEAQKKEKNNPAYSLAMYESLAKDGYAPAQYIMYKKGKGNKWLEQAALGGHFEAATGNGFLSQRIKLCEQVVERSRACATRASNGEPISEQEKEILWDKALVFDQFYHEMEMMMSNLDAAAITEDANYFPSTYKGKKGMQQAQLDMAALCKSCRDRLSRMQSFFGEQMDIIQESSKKTTTASTSNQKATTASTSTPKTTMTAEEMLEKGEDYYSKQNYVEAAKWLLKAAEQGQVKGQYAMGVFYYKGLGVTQSDVEAAKWFLKAAEQGQVEGQFALGAYYYKGLGVTQSYTEAVKWYRKAAEQGYAAAQAALGTCYYEGLGVTQSYAEAVKWYRKAAEQGQADAQYALGLCYGLGYGVTQNIEEYKKWVRKAAAQGHKDAKEEVENWEE